MHSRSLSLRFSNSRRKVQWYQLKRNLATKHTFKTKETDTATQKLEVGVFRYGYYYKYPTPNYHSTDTSHHDPEGGGGRELHQKSFQGNRLLKRFGTLRCNGYYYCN